MARWSFRILFVVLLAATVGLTVHSRALAELAGGLELELHRFRESRPMVVADPGAVAGGERDAEPAAAPMPVAAVELAHYTRLEIELHEAKQQAAKLTELLEQRNRELAHRAESAQLRAERSLRPMPEGVRLCLDALHTCLRVEGYHEQRFLSAMSLDDEGLHDVEMIDAAPDGLGVAFVGAGRMTATLDRASGTLVLRFFHGMRTVSGEQQALPDDGLAVTFREIDGRLFEQRLPFLVRGEGAYAVPNDPSRRLPGDLDPTQRRQWLSRLDLLLSGAGLERRWRSSHLRGLREAVFLELDLIGTDAKGLVQAGAPAARAVVEVDRRVGVVSLHLFDGVLHKDGIESTITGEGFRMVLPGVTPETAIDAMLGMVVTK